MLALLCSIQKTCSSKTIIENQFFFLFFTDRRLEMVQIGAGFMRLFGQKLTTCGASVATYFDFQRPRSITLSFQEIIKRANTPFVLAIRKIPGTTFLHAEVSQFQRTLRKK